MPLRSRRPSDMKVTLFGNTNNLPYLLARAIRDAGHTAALLVNQKELLHRPESVDPDLADNYPQWIHDVSDISFEHYIGPSPAITSVASLLESADGVILNHLGPSLLPYVNKPAIAFLTGSDLDYLARFDTLVTLGREWGPQFKVSAAAGLYRALWSGFITRQREGVLRSRGVSFFPRGLVPECDELLDEIGVSDAQRFHIYMADDNIKTQSSTGPRDRVRIFCGARLTWVRPMAPGTCELDYKGVDVLLRGVARFFERSGTRVELRLVEKGLHVAETHELVDQLKLRDQIVWLTEMDRPSFDRELCEADICVDQLANSVVGMSGVDAMLLGKPLLANARPEIWNETWPEPPPICHASSPEEVADQLFQLVPDASRRARIGRESRAYAEKYWSPASNAKKCLEIFGEK